MSNSKADDRTVTWTGGPNGFQRPEPSPKQEPLRGALKAGEVLEERYRIVRFIAAGGVGEVYEAHDTVLDQRVALKTIRRSRAADGEATERLKREIQLARQVAHPNICRLYELGQYPTPDGQRMLFLTMELLEGESLWELIERSGPMSTREALPLVRQMAAGLDAAHAAGVVHRDFKSSNVMLVPQKDGGLRTVITDFGLARSVDDMPDKRLTSHDMRVGTPAYMAPEQVQGLETTSASDFYAFGVVLFEMLTGRLPFEGSALAGAYQRLTEKPSSPRIYVPDLEPHWERTILRSLERDPKKRLPNGHALVNALEHDSSSERTRRWAIAGLLAALLVISALLAVSLAPWRSSDSTSENLSPQTLAAGAASAPRERPSIAIVGFRDLGDASGADWLGPALAEMIRTEAAAGERLRVISGEEVTRMQLELGLEQPPSEPRMLGKLGDLLGSELVVGGSFLVAGEPGDRQIRLDMLVQKAGGDVALARLAERGSEQKLFELVDRAGRALRGALDLDALTKGEQAEKRTALPSGLAARYYAEGIDALRRHDALRARQFFEKSIDEDPDHPLPRSALASALSALGFRREARQEARRAAERLDVLPPRDAQWVEAQVLELEGERSKALAIYRSLWAYYPDEPEYGIRLSRLQTRIGDLDEATDTLEQLRQSGDVDAHRLDLLSAQVARARSDYGRQQQLAAQAAEQAEADGVPLRAARAREIEAGALRDLGEPQRALEAFQRAMAAYRDAGLEGPLARTLAGAAIVHRHQGEFDEAQRLSQEALDIARRIGDVGTRRFALNTQAILLRQQGRLNEARALHELEVEANRQAGVERSLSVSLTSLGVVERRLGLLDAAESHFLESLEIAHRMGNGRSISINENLLAEIDIRRGRLQRATERIEQALETNQSTRDPRGRAYYLVALGDVACLSGDLEDARGKYEEALRIRQAIGESGNALRTRLALAQLALDRGENSEAAETAAQVFAELPEHSKLDRGHALALEARARHALGEPAAELTQRALREVAGLEDREMVLRVELADAVVRGDAEAAAQVADTAADLGLTDVELEARLTAARLAGDEEAWQRAEQRALDLGLKVLPKRLDGISSV